MSENTVEGAVSDAKSLARNEKFSSDQLRGITDFNAAVALAQEVTGGVEQASDVLGDGFALLPTDGKGTLVGVPLLILAYNFSEGDNGEFVTLRVITKDNRKLIVNDGSTGIRDQLKDYDSRSQGRSLYVANGFRRSDYQYDDVNQKTGEIKKKNATTFYLDTSAAV